MTPHEIRAAVRLAARAAALTTTHVERVHRAIAARPFRLVGPAAMPVRLTHDAIAGVAYACVRAGQLASGVAIGELVVAATRRQDPVPLAVAHHGNLAMAALNAAVGDRLAERGDALSIRMAVRAQRRDVPPSAGGLTDAFSNPTQRLAVFLHGLGETEDAWLLEAQRHYDDPSVCYGSRLAAEFGYTPIYLRYNTGLHISENGRLLSDLLGAVTANWPAPVAEIALLGHSMGALVARSACHTAGQSGARWVSSVRHVVCLGSPHLGAPLERGIAKLSRGLSKIGETQPFATLLNGRSVGIKDLRYGYLIDADWRDCALDTCCLNHRNAIPLLASANHYAVAATITRDPEHPLGRVVGDLLVLPASAHGVSADGRHIPFLIEHRRKLGGLHHFHLLNHPVVYQQIRGWLAPQTR